MTPRRPKKSTFADRVAWLETHQELKGIPRLEVLRKMKSDGLIAKSTYLADCSFEEEFLVAGFVFTEKVERIPR
jgi:hypothetical protein